MLKRSALMLVGDSKLGIPLKQVDRVYVSYLGRKLLYFGGCDYFRLSSDPAIIGALREGLERYGLNTAASRKTTGNHPLYEEVEKGLARFFQAETALLVSSGYLSNFAVAQSLRGETTHALIDEFSHGSLREAIKLSGLNETTFRHRDPEDLARKLKRLRQGAVAVVTDGMFAHNGSVAPLREYSKLLPEKCLLWVDDAHAAGVLGKDGRGSISLHGLRGRNVIQTVTFSKAFGVYGGAVLANAKLRAQIILKSSVVTGNTPLPLPLAFAVLKSLDLIRRDRSLRLRLEGNIARFWRHLGFPEPKVPSPILAMDARDGASLQKLLLKNGIFPSFIKYPGGPEQGYFRFALSSEHTATQVIHLAETVRSRGWLAGTDS